MEKYTIDELNGFIWKGEKKKVENSYIQETYKLIDCNEEQLQEFYNHCKTMLYNDDKNYPGRYNLLKIINDQRNRCGVELFLRSLDQKGITRYSFMESVRLFLENNREAYEAMKDYNDKNNLGPITVEFVTTGCNSEYKNLPLNLVLDGCFDRLGRFNKSHITFAFILKQGVWFTPQEIKDLTEKDSDGKVRDKLDVLKERLRLHKDTNLIITPKGLNYTQLRAMYNLTSKKYSELTTEQLSTLRYRMLFLLEDQVKIHIKEWLNRMEQIIQVAEYKGYVIE